MTRTDFLESLKIGPAGGFCVCLSVRMGYDPTQTSRCFSCDGLLETDECPILTLEGALWMIQNKHTPLHSAALGGHVQAVSALLVNGADVEAKDEVGSLPQTLLFCLWMNPFVGVCVDHQFPQQCTQQK